MGVDGGVSSETDVVSDTSSVPLTGGTLTPAAMASTVLISAAIRSTSRDFVSDDCQTASNCS